MEAYIFEWQTEYVNNRLVSITGSYRSLMELPDLMKTQMPFPF